MEIIIFIGLQAAGKSSYYKERLFHTHVHISLDMLRTRRREQILVDACLDARQAFAVDNTNPTPADRARYIGPARAAGFHVVGLYFRSAVSECLARNNGRDRAVPDKAILGTAGRLILPSLAEGFDQLRHIRIDSAAGFVVEDWRDEV